MKRLFKFLANRKGSAFIEQLMTYVAVAAIGVAVVGVTTNTIKDAAAGSPYQEEIVAAGGSNPNENGSNLPSNAITGTFVCSIDGNPYESYEITYEEGMTWREFINSEYASLFIFPLFVDSGADAVGYDMYMLDGGAVSPDDVIDLSRDYFFGI